MHHPPRHRIRGRPPGQRGHVKLAVAARQHQVAEPAAAQHPGVRDQDGLRKDRLDRRDLGPGVPQRRAVGHVDGVDPAGVKRAAGRDRELRRGQVGRRATAGEDVRDDHVEAARRHPLEPGPGVADVQPDPPAAQRQPEPDQPPQGLIHLDGHLRRRRAGRRHVTGQRERPGAQVQHPQRLTRGRGQVDQVPQPPDVLEVEVAGVVQVDVRLRDAVDQQHPRRPPVGVAQELGPAGILLLPQLPGSGHDGHYPCRAGLPGSDRVAAGKNPVRCARL